MEIEQPALDGNQSALNDSRETFPIAQYQTAKNPHNNHPRQDQSCCKTIWHHGGHLRPPRSRPPFSSALLETAPDLVEIEKLCFATANLVQPAFQNFTMPGGGIHTSHILHETFPDKLHRFQALNGSHTCDFCRRAHCWNLTIHFTPQQARSQNDPTPKPPGSAHSRPQELLVWAAAWVCTPD